MKKIFSKEFAAIAAVVAFSGSVALPVLAANVDLGVGISANANASASATEGGSDSVKVRGDAGLGVSAETKATIVQRAEERANQEIDRRIQAMNQLTTRVNAMVRLSADDKSGLSASLANQIQAMNELKARIAADAQAQSTSSLKADIQSIVKAYRIYLLVMPQAAVQAAADRTLAVASATADLAAKLQIRFTEAAAAGKNVSSSASLLADMNAKIADAESAAQAAVAMVVNLKSDNGNQGVAASNASVLKGARTKIQAAQQDLVAARKDAGDLIKVLRSLSVNASSTVSASTSAQ